MQWEWLVGPAMGGLIGYVTNDIAVRMLFRPHAAKRLFGRRLPFTPGLIPKERARLANAIGDVLDRVEHLPVLQLSWISHMTKRMCDVLVEQAFPPAEKEKKKEK